MKRLVWGAIALALAPAGRLHAQTPAINDLKGKIFDAHMAEKVFPNGLRHCNELDGTSFFLALRNRVFNLEDYRRSLQNLVRDRVFNPETKRPWNEQDAANRFEQVKQEALKQKTDCELVTRLPELERQLEELEKKYEAAKKKE